METFTGKKVLVTGASRGIGLAIATAFALEGARVFAVAQTASSSLDELVSGTDTQYVSADLSGPEGIDTLAKAVGAVDVLINNVGAAKPRPEGFLSISDEDWIVTLNLNLLAAVRTTRVMLPGMLDRPGASIVNIVSVNAELPDPAVMDYCTAKAALANFSKSLSKEFGNKVRVNWINPGPVETDLWLGKGGIADTFSGATGARPEEVQAQAVAGSDTKRFSHPNEIADLALFLAGSGASNITGAGFRIDGGLVATI